MEVVRPYGDTYFKNYWRGYRNTIGDPFRYFRAQELRVDAAGVAGSQGRIPDLADDTVHLGATVEVTNLFGTAYFHPGIREADAGLTPGFFADGVWHGSAGFYTSLMPQPGRQVLLSRRLESRPDGRIEALRRGEAGRRRGVDRCSSDTAA